MALRMRWHLGQAVPQLAYERVPVRLRAFLDGDLALDTQHGALVWEPRRIVPMYAVPEADLLVRVEPTDPPPEPPDLDELPRSSVRTASSRTPPRGRSSTWSRTPDGSRGLGSGRTIVTWRGWWCSTSAPLTAGSPRTRSWSATRMTRSSGSMSSAVIDTIEVSLDGDVLASTDNAMSLLETHLPIRYYIPPDDVASSLLTPSETRSTCAYKGDRVVLLDDGRPTRGPRHRLDLPSPARGRAPGAGLLRVLERAHRPPGRRRAAAPTGDTLVTTGRAGLGERRAARVRLRVGELGA